MPNFLQKNFFSSKKQHIYTQPEIQLNINVLFVYFSKKILTILKIF